MKIGRYLTLIAGILLGTLAVVWWVRVRKLPTVRFSYTLGKGRDVDIDWIELR